MIAALFKYEPKLKQRYLIVFISTILIGLLAHGFSFANKISFFDDIGSLHFLSTGLTFRLGRWFWGILVCINELLFGEYSSSWLNGMICLTFIGITNVLIVRILDIKKCISLILLSSIITVSVGTLVLYAYMWCAVYYSLAVLLSIFATYVYIFNFDNQFKPLKYMLSGLLIILSTAIAQNNFLFGVIIFLYYCIIRIIKDKLSFKFLVLYGLFVVVSLIVYAVLTKLVLIVVNTINDSFRLGFSHLELTSYQGINRIGLFSLFSCDNIVNVLKHIYIVDDVLFGNFLYIYYIILILILVFSICILVKHKINVKNFIFLIVVFLLIILSVNIIYILQPPTYVYALTVYQKSLIFIVPILICELYGDNLIQLALLYILSIYYMFYGIALSNRVNLWRYFKQQEEIRWISTLATRIQSVQGYDDNYDVYVYGNGKGWSIKKNDKYYAGAPWSINNNNIYPFNNDTIQYYTWVEYLSQWCGFDISRFRLNDFNTGKEQIADMPCYPDDGSIKVIDDKVIVKFSEID